MSVPLTNIFSQVEQFSEILDPEDLLEGRFENNDDGNPIYIGYCPIPNAATDEPIWFIRKVVYDGTNVIRTQLPDDGIQFQYIWDNRADYFT